MAEVMERVTVRSLRALDALVAERVCHFPIEQADVAWDLEDWTRGINATETNCLAIYNHCWTGSSTGTPKTPKYWVIPEYSAAIADAWQVAEKLKLALVPQSDGERVAWLAMDLEVVRYTGDVVLVEKNGSGFSHKSAPIAICLAALKTVGIEVTLALTDG